MHNSVRLIEGSHQASQRLRKTAVMADLYAKEYGSIAPLIEEIRRQALQSGIPEVVVDAQVGMIIDARRRLAEELDELAEAAARVAALTGAIATAATEIQRRRRAALRQRGF